MKAHLTLAERKSIERSLDKNESLRSIAENLGKAASTISREIRKHSEETLKVSFGRISNRCARRNECSRRLLCGDSSDCIGKCTLCGKCNSVCPDFDEEVCPKLSLPPYVCNGCPNRNRCTLRKRFYSAARANEEYNRTLRESRSGFNFNETELKNIDAFYSPRVKNGQSIYHVAKENKDQLPCSPSTYRRLVNAGAVSARNIDLPRTCRFKPRAGKPRIMKVDSTCREGRTYQEFLLFSEKNPDLPVAEIDSVVGQIGGKVLLTILLKNCGFMLAFLRERNTARSVCEVFESLYTTLGAERYSSMFGILLADNGTEFSNPQPIEFTPEGNRRSCLFYCDPYSPYEKGTIENSHSLLRRILPKGSSFDPLTQEKLNKIMSHINSYGRAKFNGKSPAQLLVKLYGKETLHLLGQELIRAERIKLRPELVR